MHIICFKSSCFFHTFFCLAVRSLLLNPNLTTVTAMKSALESSTTSTPMVSNGMTFLATTKNQLFVNFKSMDTNKSQVELTNIMKHSIAHYCLNCEKKRVLHTIIETISKQNFKNVVYIRKTINTYLKTLGQFFCVGLGFMFYLLCLDSC